MDVRIEAASQAEFDAKRARLAKALTGKPPLVPRRGTFAYQNALLARLKASVRMHLEQAKREIDVVLKRSGHG